MVLDFFYFSKIAFCCYVQGSANRRIAIKHKKDADSSHIKLYVRVGSL